MSMELVGDKHYECGQCGFKAASALVLQVHACVSEHECDDSCAAFQMDSDPTRTAMYNIINKKLDEILDQQRWLERVILERLG